MKKLARFAKRSVFASRMMLYRTRWTCTDIVGVPEVVSPVLSRGGGRIEVGESVVLGWPLSPGHYVGCSWIEARNEGARVSIGDGGHLNTGVTIVSDRAGVSIGRRAVVGAGVEIFDSDFHPLSAADRRTGKPPTSSPVVIGDDVFLGNRVTVLQGVTIGDRAVIGVNSVVTADVPADSIVAGNPARVIRTL